MSGQERCHRRTLAHRGVFQVDFCECGMIHVTCGAVTVRLMPQACEAFCATLAEAMQRLARQGGETIQ